MKYFNVLLTTTLALSSCAVVAQLTEHQPKILFDSWTPAAGDDRQIYVMDPDGSNLQRLTEKQPGMISGWAAWSPDHQKIAFKSNRDGEVEIYVMDADGSNVQQLTSSRGMIWVLLWSLDGNQIFFERDTDPPATGVYVMDSDGSNVQRLTEFETTWGSWSPDGERYAFTGYFDGIREIYVMDSDGGNVERLTHTPVREGGSFAPKWSPDGQKIVFDSTRDGNFEIYVMDPDGSNVQRLTHNDKMDARPAWSPDGQRIVFHSTRDGNTTEIYVMDADGGNVERLTFNDHRNVHPDW